MSSGSSEGRPLAATGHLVLQATDVKSACRRLIALGIREVALREEFAVLELRGGTHIVVQRARFDGVFNAQFDLMYDDIDAAHERFRDGGFEVSGIERGGVHRAFTAVAPEGYRVQVVDSHVGDRVV